VRVAVGQFHCTVTNCIAFGELHTTPHAVLCCVLRCVTRVLHMFV
jgi:hypothetical protein